MKHFLHLLFIVLLVSGNVSLGIAQQQAGDIIVVNGAKFQLLSDNLIPNPGFEEGFTSWTDATFSAAQLSSGNFTLVQTGGVDNSQYLVGTKNESSSSAGSIGTGWAIEADKTYYFSYQVKYRDASTAAGAEQWLKVSLTHNKNSSSEPLKVLDEAQVSAGGAWTKNEVVFTNSNPAYSYVVARFRWLNNLFGFDDFALYEVQEVPNVEALQATIDEAQSMYDAGAVGAAELQAAIATAQGFLTSTSAADVLQAIADLKEVITDYKYSNATPEAPLDMTSYIVNPSFESGFTGWANTGMATQFNIVFPKNGTYYIEKWVNRGLKVPDVSVEQQLTGIPNGKYRLTASAGNIQQSASGSAVNNSATPQTGVTLFAGFNTTAVDTVKQRSVDFIVVNNEVTIGLKAVNATGNWVACDNFRLYYTGKNTDIDYAEYLKGYIAHVETLLTKKMQNPVKADVQTAIAQAEQAIDANPLVLGDLQEAKEKLETVYAAAEASMQLYGNLQNAIDYANKIMGWYEEDQTKKEKMQAAITTANAALNNFDLTTAEINKAIADLDAVTKSVDKKIYIPTWMMGDVNNSDNSWSYTRSKQSKNWIVFWEKGYSDDPDAIALGSFTLNLDALLNVAEKSFEFYADSLKFITKGSSKTDQYKMIIRIRYTTDWEASGSGVDDLIGLLTLTAWSANDPGHTVAHEVGHCFQYQVHCDNGDQNGWMYGYGDNASGGNGWWEQCAQWQAFKVYPTQQFTDGRFANYMNTVHKHILHETPRYDNYFIQDYWTYRHGMDIIGRLWNESKRPEDPVETYKRITSITQSQFNDEMYDCAARFATWNIPDLRSYGASKITTRPQPAMTDAGDNYWLIGSSVCLENYGHNIIKLNAPTAKTTVSAFFEGKAGMDGFRKNYVEEAGWRYGFVAWLKDGSRVYGDMGSATYQNPTGNISFECPDNCRNLWLVVSGAPQTHWRHAWDDNDSNDEQWAYQVKFNNTNLLGKQNVLSIESQMKGDIQIYTSANELFVEQITPNSTVVVYDITGRCLLNKFVQETTFTTTLPSGIYIITVSSGRENYNQKVVVK